MDNENIKEVVRDKYAHAALRAASGKSSCCGTSPASINGCDPITAKLYGENETSTIPEKALRASLGCGNPTALAKLQPGETVLDPAPAVALMSCSRRNEWDQLAKPTGWI